VLVRNADEPRNADDRRHHRAQPRLRRVVEVLVAEAQRQAALDEIDIDAGGERGDPRKARRPDAIGRDYLLGGRFFAIDADGKAVHATLYGLLGISAGLRSGFELHALGLVAGVDIVRPGLKIPAIGRIGI
jgi:hypothetical protein